MSQHATSKESGSHHSPASRTIIDGKISATTSSQPALRVSLLGPFAIEQANGTHLNLDTLLGRSQSSILLKLLLCHPERRVIRERLIDALWPGQPYSTMEGSLGVAKSILKTRLETVCRRPIVPRVSGDPPSYSLVGQAVIWTDVDACEQFIRQAINAKSTQNALPLWEAAYALLQRGTLLADDQAAYWYQASLVQERRKRLARQCIQCVLRIVDLSLELKDPSRAVTVLSSESEAHPANEEIAFRLMELLAQQGRRAEALQCYTELEAALLESDAETGEETKALAHRLRSSGVLPSLSTAREAADLQERQLPSHATGVSSSVLQPAGMLERQRSLSSPSIDWGEAPYSKQFYGREKELSTLRSWIVEDQCRLVAILGVGGIGKTSLAAAFVGQVRDGFTALFWRSLQNAPPLRGILQDCITLLSGQRQIELPDNTDQQIALLLEYLRMYRCLLVLDNVETVMQAGAEAGTYREGYEHYQRLFQRIGEAKHQSCLLLTSREKLKEMARLEGTDAPVRSIILPGVGLLEGRALLKEKGLSGPHDAWERLIQLYAGNPLALKLISELIRDVFNANIAAFLQEGQTVVGDIYDLLNHQFQRLSEREKDIMYWLAIEREAVPLQTLWEDTRFFASKKAMLAVLASLRQRSLIETDDTARFTLQPAIMEYVLDEFIRQVYEEILAGTIGLLASHALMKAQAKEYLREAQVRLILTPLAERLLVSPGREASEQQFRALLERLHETSPQKLSYVAGNLLNLLIHMRYDLAGYDFSGLSIRQAFLAGKTLSGLNVVRADLATSVFTDTFGSILSVAFSPDGAWLAAGTTKNDIRLWQAHSGTPYLTLQGHTAWVRSVAFSPDGRMLASGGDDQTIRLWEVSGGNCLNTLRGHAAWVRSVAFSPDGSLLASGGEDQTIRLWEVTSGQCLKTLQDHKGRVRIVAFHPARSLLASGGEDQTIRLWEVKSGRCLNILQGHTERIRDIAFSPDGRTIASGSDDGTLRLWDTSSGTCLKTLQGHTDCVRSVAFSPERSVLASGSEDRTVRLWDVMSGNCLNVLQGHSNWVWSVAFHPDGNVLASGSEDQTIRLWQAEDGRCFKTLQGYVNWAWSVAFSPNGEVLASGSEDQMVRMWETSSGNCLNTLQGHSSRVRSVAFRPDGSLLASSSEDRTIRLWEVDSGRCLKTLQDYTYRIWSIAFSPDGTMLAGGGEDYAVCVWETSSGLMLQTLQGHTDRIRAVAFSSGNIIASASEDQTARLWDVSTGACLHILRGHIGRVWSVAFSSDGEVLASGGDDCTIRLWHVGDGHHLDTLQGHTARVRSLAFRPDGSMLASGSEDYTIRLWECSTGSCLSTLQGHTGRIRSLAFHPHKPLLISSSDDGTIKFWNTDTSSCMNTLRTHQPYEGMDITGATGLTEVQKATLKVLGAVEESIR